MAATKKGKRGPGRPPFPAGTAREHRLPARVTEAELDSYQSAADRAQVTLSEWIRATLSRAARRPKR